MRLCLNMLIFTHNLGNWLMVLLAHKPMRHFVTHQTGYKNTTLSRANAVYHLSPTQYVTMQSSPPINCSSVVFTNLLTNIHKKMSVNYLFNYCVPKHLNVIMKMASSSLSLASSVCSFTVLKSVYVTNIKLYAQKQINFNREKLFCSAITYFACYCRSVLKVMFCVVA